MGLALAAQQRLVGLVVAGHHQGRILVQQPVKSGGQLVLVGLGGGLTAMASTGGGGRGAGTCTGVPFGARVSPVLVSASLATAAEVTRRHRGDGQLFLAPEYEQAVQAFVTPVRELTRWSSWLMVPESTLKSEILPT